jgi:plastocyanin
MHVRNRAIARVAAVATAAALVTALAACSSSKSDTSTKTTRSTGSGASAARQSSSAPVAAANAVTVQAMDEPSMGYQVTGAPKAGLVTITFTNAGDDSHEMTLVRLKPGVTLDQVKAALKQPDPDKAASSLLVDPDGEITGPALLGPGHSETVTAPLVAGNYAIVCFLPGPDGMPHAVMGMVAGLTVAAGNTDAGQPQTQGTIELTDKGITVPDGVGSGGVYAVKNTGTTPHDFSTAALKAGTTLPGFFQCVGESFGKSTPIDKCPGTITGGVTTMQPGQTAYLALTLAPGTYSYLSTEGDGKDVQAGLQGSFTVA